MNNQPSNYDLVIGFLQVFDLLLNVSQSSNDDIMKQLQKQDKEYLEKIVSNQLKIIEQNDKILSNQDIILTRLGSD
jgi:arginine utilization protein RocB